MHGSKRSFIQGIKAGSGSLEDLLTTALAELCKVKPEGLDAVRRGIRTKSRNPMLTNRLRPNNVFPKSLPSIACRNRAAYGYIQYTGIFERPYEYK